MVTNGHQANLTRRVCPTTRNWGYENPSFEVFTDVFAFCLMNNKFVLFHGKVIKRCAPVRLGVTDIEGAVQPVAKYNRGKKAAGRTSADSHAKLDCRVRWCNHKEGAYPAMSGQACPIRCEITICSLDSTSTPALIQVRLHIQEPLFPAIKNNVQRKIAVRDDLSGVGIHSAFPAAAAKRLHVRTSTVFLLVIVIYIKMKTKWMPCQTRSTDPKSGMSF